MYGLVRWHGEGERGSMALVLENKANKEAPNEITEWQMQDEHFSRDAELKLGNSLPTEISKIVMEGRMRWGEGTPHSSALCKTCLLKCPHSVTCWPGAAVAWAEVEVMATSGSVEGGPGPQLPLLLNSGS